jgi:hypothetical protein
MQNTLQLKKYSRRLFYSSSLAVISVYSAWYNKLYYAMMRSLIVLCTSMLYWNDPSDGVIRKIDIMSANGCIGYQWIYTSTELSIIPWTLYTVTVIACLKCYINARYHGRKPIPDFDMASRWHMLIHIFGNIGNVILYNGVGKQYFINT